MSSIIPELIVTLTNHFNDDREATNQSTLLPDPAIKDTDLRGVECTREQRERTFAIYP
jgi:hypothetical protein